MLKIISYFLLFLSVTYSSDAVGQIKLSIQISDLRNSHGCALLELMDENKKIIRRASAAIAANTCLFTFKNLQKEKYSFRFFHDENNNKTLDTYWMGAPKEGYGFSNQSAKVLFPPSFQNSLVTLNNDTLIHCKPTYINF